MHMTMLHLSLFYADPTTNTEINTTSRQYEISIYEVLAKVHGKNIIPDTKKIMATVVKTLSSSAGSLPLQRAYGRVIVGIGRCGID